MFQLTLLQIWSKISGYMRQRQDHIDSDVECDRVKEYFLILDNQYIFDSFSFSKLPICLEDLLFHLHIVTRIRIYFLLSIRPKTEITLYVLVEPILSYGDTFMYGISNRLTVHLSRTDRACSIKITFLFKNKNDDSTIYNI